VGRTINIFERRKNMGKLNLSNIAKGVRTAMKKHSPEILTGIGIAGMITTTVMVVRATPKAIKLIEEEKDRQNIKETASNNKHENPAIKDVTNNQLKKY
jgi:hypothetical protein